MIRNANRNDFKHSILVALGHPYINVNLSDEHLDLCINNALKAFWKYHPDGVVETYYIYDVTDTDVTNGYIPVPVWFDSVVECIDLGFSFSSANFATAEYQMLRGAFLSATGFTGVSLTDYVCMKQMLYHTKQVLGGPSTFVFDRYRRRINPLFKLESGKKVIFRVYENVDPEKNDNPSAPDAPNVWDDEVLKDFTIAEAKMLWGDILSKYGGIQLPGGVTLDGQRLIQEGKELKEETLHYLKNQPIDFFMG